MKIRFINHSELAESRVVFFQKNDMVTKVDQVVAWHIIETYPEEDYLFQLPSDFGLSVKEHYGNRSNIQPARNGQKWNVMRDPRKKMVLAPDPTLVSKNPLEVHNLLNQETIDVLIYKNERLLGIKPGLYPNHKSTFQFGKSIGMGVVDASVEEGDFLDPLFILLHTTEFFLPDVPSIQITMTKGRSLPPEFSLYCEAE